VDAKRVKRRGEADLGAEREVEERRRDEEENYRRFVICDAPTCWFEQSRQRNDARAKDDHGFHRRRRFSHREDVNSARGSQHNEANQLVQWHLQIQPVIYPRDFGQRRRRCFRFERRRRRLDDDFRGIAISSAREDEELQRLDRQIRGQAEDQRIQR